jgi:hypothetical protein
MALQNLLDGLSGYGVLIANPFVLLVCVEGVNYFIIHLLVAEARDVRQRLHRSAWRRVAHSMVGEVSLAFFKLIML